MAMNARIGVLNVSDRASAGVYADTPGQSCVALLREWLSTPFEIDYRIVPDEQKIIEGELRRMHADHEETLILVFLGPGLDIGDRAQAIDAGVGPEIDQHDLTAQTLCC